MDIRELIKDSFQGVAMGMMDGLITLLGIVMGVGIATGDAKFVILSGLVGGISNSFGTSIGFYTSEQAERGQQLQFYRSKSRKVKEADKYIHSEMDIYLETAVSFIAATLVLILPLLPFFLAIPVTSAMAACFAISILLLYILGFYIGKLHQEDRFRSGVKYVLIGMVSAAIALLLGELLKHLILENTIGLF